MMSVKSVLATTAVALVLALGAGQADAKTDHGKVAKAPSPESVECSKQADAKSLHGKERKAFRKTCLKEANAAKKTTAASEKPAAEPKKVEKKAY